MDISTTMVLMLGLRPAGVLSRAGVQDDLLLFFEGGIIIKAHTKSIHNFGG